MPTTVPNPTTVEALTEGWAHQSLRAFRDRLGGDVLLGLVDEASGVYTWSFLTEVRAKDGRSAALDRRTRVHILRPRDDRAGDGNILLVGRAEASDVHLDHPSVSKLHARIRLPGPYLIDSGSRNGTFLEDEPLADGEERPLEEGARIELGDCQLRFHTADRLYAMIGAFVD